MTRDATTTLGHINIRTDRVEETVAFFEAVLGFTRGEAATNPDPARNVWLFDGQGAPSIHINLFKPGETLRDGDGRLHHVAFNCPDRDAMAERLAGLGIGYDVVETRVPGLVQFNIRDPNNVLVELTFGHAAVRRRC